MITCIFIFLFFFALLPILFKGTPDELNWPTITHGLTPESKKFLEHRKSKAHRTHKGEDWSTYAPRFDHFGRLLLKKFLEFPTDQRICAKAALRHEVFRVSAEIFFFPNLIVLSRTTGGRL